MLDIRGLMMAMVVGLSLALGCAADSVAELGAAADSASGPGDSGASGVDATGASDGAANNGAASDVGGSAALADAAGEGVGGADAGAVDAGPTCEDSGSFVPWPLSCEAAVVADVAAVEVATQHLELVVSGTQTLLVYADGGAVFGSILDAAGVPGPPLLVDDAGGSLAGVAASEDGQGGWRVFVSRGELPDGSTMPSVVGADGALTPDPDHAIPNYIVGRGASLGPVGYRLWGRRETTDAGQTWRSAMMARLDMDGALQGVHFLQNVLFFEYMELHASGVLLNIPFSVVDPPGVSYFLAGTDQVGCGLPIKSGADFPEGSALVASAYLDGRPTWLLETPVVGCGSQGRVLVHNTLEKTTQTAALPFGASGPVALVDGSDEGLLALSGGAGGVRASLVRSSKMLVTDEIAVLDLPGETVLSVRAQSVGNGWQIAFSASSEVGARVGVSRFCAP